MHSLFNDNRAKEGPSAKDETLKNYTMNSNRVNKACRLRKISDKGPIESATEKIRKIKTLK